MKTKKTLAFLGAMVLGAFITATIDSLIGVSFADVSAVVHITHKVTYMAWGVAVIVISEKIH